MKSENVFFKGEKLFGDDFDVNQIVQWFQEEKEGYADLGAKNETNYSYVYHSLNELHGYSFVKRSSRLKVLSIGGAYGDEVRPIIKLIESLDILEPSEQMKKIKIDDVSINYINPNIDGKIDIDDSVYDLITCFGVLHHIPNVSFVMKEMARVLKPGGVMLIREPIVSMGDWTKPRKGLTKNERGIPLNLFRGIIANLNLSIKNEALCFTKPFDTLVNKIFKVNPYNIKIFVKLDSLLAKLFSFNYRYYSQNYFQSVRPTCVYYVLTKKTDCENSN
jgi:2-polyprenyl-3-methyl-5-hydroxy-6-metoxy-1,4-benzoquinol methylase